MKKENKGPDYRAHVLNVDDEVLKAPDINARDLDDAWHQALFNLINGDGYLYKIDKGSYEKTEWRLEYDHIRINISYPGTKPIIPTTREGVPPPTSLDYVENTYITKLLTDERGSGEDYTYGERIVSPAKFLEEVIEGEVKLKEEFQNLNQMLKVIEDFKVMGYNSNQEVIQIASPLDLWKVDPPCAREISCRARYNKLHFITTFRSWDLWAGLPSNLAGFQLVKELMADEIGIEDGGIIASSPGLHIYTQYWEMVEAETGIPIEKWKVRNQDELSKAGYDSVKAVYDEYAQIQAKKAIEEKLG